VVRAEPLSGVGPRGRCVRARAVPLPNSRSSRFHCPKHSAAFLCDVWWVAYYRAYVSPSGRFDPEEARGKWDLGEMRIISMMCPALILAGCTFLNDAPPKVIYQSSDTNSGEYADDAMMP
jgi:hypothetical protein